VADFAALHVEHAFEGERRTYAFERTVVAGGFPAEAIDYGREAARLFVERKIADTHQRVLSGRRDNIEVGGVLR
jgi:hypothetical protein